MLVYPWLTGFDLARHNVPPGEILDGGPPKDGIPAILQPKFVSASDAVFLTPEDQVVGVVVAGKARAYPLKILNWHEVVDDAVADRPFAVTYCPLTASAIVYDRMLGRKPVMLGVSGKLYQSNLLFYDKATESLWSQIKGEAVAGALTGSRLEPLPSVVTPWAIWRKAHPDTLVLDVNTGYSRNYALDPYGYYEGSSQVMFPVSPSDDRLPAKERVLGLPINGVDEAFPFSRLAAAKLPQSLELGGQHVTLIFDADSQTAGALIGDKHVPAYTGYWFGWAAFHPETAIWLDPRAQGPASPKSSSDDVSPKSGVYGFSGAGSASAGKRGVIGECIWIYDASNRKQVASGECSTKKPGEFRVPLAPGNYVVRGPGGSRAVEIRRGKWIWLNSVVEMPQVP
jgi:hypothetical protein